jgi:hypothetical protein
MLTWTAAIAQLCGFSSPDRRKESAKLGLWRFLNDNPSFRGLAFG